MRKNDDNRSTAIRRRQPGVGIDLRLEKGDHPNARSSEASQRSPVNQVHMVQDFGGTPGSPWQGRDVGARADRLAPERPGREKTDAPSSPVVHGDRSPA